MTTDAASESPVPSPTKQDEAGASEENPKAQPDVAAETEEAPGKPKGRPASGRGWKARQGRKQSRASSMMRVEAARSSFGDRMIERKRTFGMKALEKEIKDHKQEELDKEKRKMEQRRKQRVENARKSVVGQVVTNPTKIKKMLKKRRRINLMMV
eukprot:TRINITY_DN18825_c0_g1_i1.p2 TRINITY_DN18825_c0_g1~~TRINITY_DN18825_c0_g1_i1.p2  ORF type:complete len:155 (-),score=45.37 TRINITY_DN18825_c0_g1_i1:117-581(-)